MRSVAAYCGSSIGANPAYAQTARDLGRLLAERNVALVYGGGGLGLMGELADSVLRHGGKAVGVIPEFLKDLELGHRRLTEMIIVADMHERKRRMIDLAEGFIALPGGYGTLDELAEVLAWSQLGLHRRPCGVINVEGYFDGLLMQLDRMVRSGLLRPEDRARLVTATDPEELLAALLSWTPPASLKFG